jgi:hypothetical protein
MPLDAAHLGIRVGDVPRDAAETDRMGRKHGDVLLGVKPGHHVARHAVGAVYRAGLLRVARQIGEG